jgi:hypothetical protein
MNDRRLNGNGKNGNKGIYGRRQQRELAEKEYNLEGKEKTMRSMEDDQENTSVYNRINTIN